MDHNIPKCGYNSQEAMQKYAGEILQKLPTIDRVSNTEEMESLIREMLQILGKCSGAQRAYIFDRVEKDGEEYRNTYEWCAPKISSKISFLEKVRASDMPQWIRIFEAGEKVIISDLEEIRESMPQEYQALKACGVFSEIAAPVYNRNRLSGFIGLDNPYQNVSQLFIQQLAFVGAHLNTARENLRMIDVMEKELRKKEAEQQLLMLLCTDSTSVFKLNLFTDMAETVKLDQGANAVKIIGGEENTSFCFSQALKYYFDHYVIKESLPDYLEIFSTENLRKELREKDRISRKYQTVRNLNGKQYFEIRVSRLNDREDGCLALVDFRSIDEIVREERKHQKELEKALEETRMNNEIISALGKIYFRIYRINLSVNYYEEIAGGSSQLHLTGCHGNACERMKKDCQEQVARDYQGKVEEFLDLTTIAERLKEEDSIAMEYLASDGNWHLARFIVQNRDSLEKVEQVLFVIRLISEEKRREKYLISEVEDARKANEAKSEFLSRMSHDIRTPMNAIMGFANIAKKHLEEPAKIEDCLNKIQLSGGNLQQLIDDVLDISKIESGEFKLNCKPVSVEEVFELYQQTISGMLVERKLHYISDKHGILHDVLFMDQLRLSQIFINLLSNAIKYTPEGGTIRFELFEEAINEPGRVRLVGIVSDNGIGMSPEFMKEMYSEFSRAVDTRVNKVRGSGLGLAIVKKIVDLMGGTIQVESELQKGTTFRVELELAIAENEKTEADHSGGKQDLEISSRGMRLLVAEDNDLNYEILMEQLKMLGVSCTRAVNGKECLEIFEKCAPGEFDGILMDMQMPVMNGLEAATLIRKLEHPMAKKIPIIALTANAYENDAKKCMNAGMNAHLAKPVEVEQVIREVRKYQVVS